MRLLPVVSLAVWLSVAALTGEGAGGPPEALARKVSALLAAAKPDYPDPWRPRYTRPRRVVVIPGEKLSYGERLTAMALAGLANRDGPRLFIRGHFGFNADADRFWLRRLADDYGIRHSEIGLDDALEQFRSSVRGCAAIAATLRAAKPVEGQHLAVTLAWAGERAEHKVPIRPVAPIEDAREGLVLHSVWEAGKLSHNTGAEASDADAHNRTAWRTDPGKHKAGTHAVWGPYEDLPPGRYTAVFRLKAARRAEAPVARLDVYNHWLGKEGKQGIRAERTLKGTDFAAAGRYQDIALDFDRTATGKVEYRVHWPGKAAVSVDRVVILRLPIPAE